MGGGGGEDSRSSCRSGCVLAALASFPMASLNNLVSSFTSTHPSEFSRLLAPCWGVAWAGDSQENLTTRVNILLLT